MTVVKACAVVFIVAMLIVSAPPGFTAMSPADAEPLVRLPSPDTEGGPSLSSVLTTRRSVRSFADAPLSLEQLGQLCWSAQGITASGAGFRTAPSAGGLYPLTVFLVRSRGVFEYLPREHALRRVADDDRRPRLQRSALGQSSVGEAPVCLIVTANVGQTARKYGARAERYCLMEAGHVAQNVLLQATALELGGVPVGAFDDEAIADVLELPDRLRPLYLLPIGVPKDS
jgi:SagB-type dehydrogenase family enzyme